MSFLEPQSLTSRQKAAAVITIMLMVPVFLDVLNLIDLGSLRLAPFLLLMIVTPFTLPEKTESGRAG